MDGKSEKLGPSDPGDLAGSIGHDNAELFRDLETFHSELTTDVAEASATITPPIDADRSKTPLAGSGEGG